MKLAEKNTIGTASEEELILDPLVEQALGRFRDSVHAWSEAEFGKARSAVRMAPQRAWRLAAGVALGLVLVTGGVSGGLYERHRQVETAKAAEKAAEQRRLAAQERARLEEEDLLAKVDSDVSREVPQAMEPLAQLMDTEESR